jgi:hypothetical protein
MILLKLEISQMGSYLFMKFYINVREGKGKGYFEIGFLESV